MLPKNTLLLGSYGMIGIKLIYYLQILNTDINGFNNYNDLEGSQRRTSKSEKKIKYFNCS